MMKMAPFTDGIPHTAAVLALGALSCILLCCHSATLQPRPPLTFPVPKVRIRPGLEIRLFCPDGHEGNCSTCPTERWPGLGNAASGDCSNVTSVAGFVQVKLTDWVFVSPEGWSETDMEVACHQLGYPNQFGCPDAADLLGCDPASNITCGGSEFQRDIGLVTMANMECKGREINLGRCQHLGWYPTANRPRQVAAVACGYSGQHRCPTGANARVRLRAGPIPSIGRLEVLHEGEWGTVCGNNLDFTLSDANVACLSMGFGSVKFAFPDGRLGRGFDRVWLNRLGCSGDESSLEECKHPGFGAIEDYRCEGHHHDMGLSCNSPQDSLDCEAEVRFYADSYHPTHPGAVAMSDKFLEVNVEGEWGLVCFEPSLSRSVLTVLCRDLEGKFGVRSRPGTPQYYNGTKRFLGHLNCTGEEVTANDCSMNFTEVDSCLDFETVVDCTSELPDLLPDIDTFRKSINGWVHVVPMYYLQCELEEGCLAADVESDNRHLLKFSTLSINRGLADFHPFEPPDQWEFHQCHNHYHSHDTFAHYELLFPDGRTAAEGRKASFCLEDSICIETQRRYSGCQNYGQGISKDCGDLYSSRVSCQWIDITGVKGGNYVIQVTVSPGQEVPESDYENNQISCNITLYERNGYYLPMVAEDACARRGYSSLKP